MPAVPDPRKEIPRHELIAAALDLGIERPEALTQAELQQHIRDVSEGRVPAAGVRPALGNGWFTVARHLVASVIEKGLNLPTAARVLRDTVRSVPPERPPLPTVTLAQIYIAQGHAERAVATLDQVLRRDPKNPKALRLRAELTQTGDRRGSQLNLTWIERDAVVILQQQDGAVAYWETTRATWERHAGLELKVALFTPTETGAQHQDQCVTLSGPSGQSSLTRDPRTVVRAALGCTRDGRWVPLAVASTFRDERGDYTLEFSPRSQQRDQELLSRALGAVARNSATP